MLGVDVRELFADEGTLTPRYVLWLVEWLSEDAATIASARGGIRHRGWTTDRHLAVSIVDLLARANYQRGGGKGKEPKPIPRPTPRRARRTVTVAELGGTQPR